jgi:uncharacterized caspase-like protein
MVHETAYHSILITVCLLLVCTALGSAQDSQRQFQEPRKVALVMGNAAYPAGPLQNAVKDATDITAMLRRLSFEVTLLQNAPLQEIEEAVNAFNLRLRQGGMGLFYFAGHGVQIDGENYLIPINARIARQQDVRYQAMPLGRIMGAMKDAGNNLNIIILDACRDMSFSRSWRPSQAGLALPPAARGMLIAYATAPGGVVTDGTGENGVYTKYLLQAMTVPGLSIEQLFKQVRSRVVAETGGKQIPWETSSLLGNFYFAPQLATPQPSSSQPVSPTPAAPLPVAPLQPPVVAASPSGTPNLRALVIGNAAYPTSPLTNPVNDATDMAALLRRLGFDATLHKNADRPTMEKAVDLFTRGVPRGSAGLFFFAGHGVQIDGVNYLLPIGAQLDAASDVKYHAVAADWVLARMDESGMDVKLLLLDACRNNPLGRSFQRTLSRGLGVMETPQGALIAYATSPGKTADDGPGRNSPFTVQLLRELVITGRDIEVALKAVRVGVQQTTKGKQIPWVASSMTGDFYVAR